MAQDITLQGGSRGSNPLGTTMDNQTFICPTCRAVSERVYNPSFVEGFQRIVFSCGRVIDSFNLQDKVISHCNLQLFMDKNGLGFEDFPKPSDYFPQDVHVGVY